MSLVNIHFLCFLIMFIFWLSFFLVNSEKEKFSFETVRSFPHDSSDFTQGFLIEREGIVIESTGLYGKSKLKRYQMEDGVVLDSIDLEGKFFGEGLVNLNGKLYQLTWREHTMLVYKQTDFSLLETVSLPSEISSGWGLCTDGTSLYITEGSAKIFVMDPSDYSIVKTLIVSDDGETIKKLNELEYIEGEIWANVFYSHLIVRIDPGTGAVNSYVDMTGLEKEGDYKTWGGGDVLNGIAYYDGKFYVTGKRWSTIYQINVVKSGI